MTTITRQQEYEEATYALEAARKDRRDGFGVYAMLTDEGFATLEQRLLDWQARAREQLEA